MLKPGRFCKHYHGDTTVEILSCGFNMLGKRTYTVRYKDGGYDNRESSATWYDNDFKDIAPEGFTLEEAKLYFAL